MVLILEGKGEKIIYLRVSNQSRAIDGLGNHIRSAQTEGEKRLRPKIIPMKTPRPNQKEDP